MTCGTNCTAYAYRHDLTKQGAKSGGAGIGHHAYTYLSSENTVKIEIKNVIGA